MSVKMEYEALPQTERHEEVVRKKHHLKFWCTSFAAHLAIFATYTLLFVAWRNPATDEICAERLSRWTPAIDEISYMSVAYSGRINTTNDFRSIGPPTPTIDGNWRRISLGVPGYRIFEEDFTKMGKSIGEKPWHKLPEEMGGGYLGMIEVFHLLHCLDAIRKQLYPELYAQEWKHNNQANFRLHQDHCVDILRQHLMCTADMGVVPFYDDENPLNENAMPDFSTVHKCRDFDRLLGWSNTNDRALHWGELGSAVKVHRPGA